MLLNEEIDDLGALLRQCFADSEPTDEFVDRLHDRLICELENIKPLESRPLPANCPRPVATGTWNRIAHYTGGLTMRQRIVFGSIAAAVSLALIVFCADLLPRRLSAMERMAEGIRQAKSYKMTSILEIKIPGKPQETAVVTMSDYWLAPKSFRHEEKGNQFASRINSTWVFSSSKPGIRINHDTKKYHRLGDSSADISLLWMVNKLSEFSGQADRKLGTKEIHGRTASGFEIDGKKIDLDAYPGPVEIWLDSESNLPVFVRCEKRSPIMSAPMIERMEDFEWNIELDPKLFDAEAPAGYAEEQFENPTPEKLLKDITYALKTYAELCGGHYPRIRRRFDNPVREEMFKAAGFLGPWTADKWQSKQFQRLLEAWNGFGYFSQVQDSDADAAYYGNAVGPSDKDKVLLRWKLADGRYQVIFGDLHSDAVRAIDLRKLEAR